MSSNSTPATAKVILMASALPLSGKYESLYFGIALVKIRTKTARGLNIWRGLLSMETEMWWNVMWPSRVNSERQSQLAWLTWLQRNLSSLFRQKWVERGVKVGIWYLEILTLWINPCEHLVISLHNMQIIVIFTMIFVPGLYAFPKCVPKLGLF